jgi:predicted RND superfamily exporter protein
MLIQARSPEHDFTHPESLRLLSDIQNDLMHKLPHFSSTFSMADYVKEINRAFNYGDEKFYRIPDTRADILDYCELAEPDILDHAVAPDMMEARISFQSRWGSNALAKKYNAMIIRYMKEKLGTNYSYRITGISSLYLSMGENLQRSQIKSFLSAFIIIFIMMYFVCGNIPLTVISMIPNLFPIMLTLGLMGIMNIPLDIVTIMIASVVIGIAVDDTIHYIVWLKRNCTGGMDVQEALIKTYRDTGKPIVMTSVVLTFGFFILVLGAVRPTQTFGVLTAFSMATALFGDMVILPALIRLFRPPIIRTGK